MYWGVALFFCSMAYARKTGKWYYYLISLLSVFAHKCLYICPLFIPLAFIRINKKTLPLVLLLFVFMVLILKYVFGSIILLDAYMDGFSNSIEHYTESDIEGTVFGRSVGEKVIYFAEFLGTIILIITIIYISVKNNPPIPAYIQSLMSLGVFFLLLAFAFIIGNFDNGTLGWRYLTISWFPLVLVCSYFKENRYIKKEIWSLAVGILLFSFEASLTVPIYYAYIG